MMKSGIYFILIALLGAEFFQDFDLCKLDDLMSQDWHKMM